MKLRLAIIGAGPAGIYAADILLKHDRGFDVSIIDIDTEIEAHHVVFGASFRF